MAVGRRIGLAADLGEDMKAAEARRMAAAVVGNLAEHSLDEGNSAEDNSEGGDLAGEGSAGHSPVERTAPGHSPEEGMKAVATDTVASEAVRKAAAVEGEVGHMEVVPDLNPD